MQEHIRRAHPDHYIAKLPATEESFQLMISTPPSERPQAPLHSHSSSNTSFTNNNSNNSGAPRESTNVTGAGASIYNRDNDQHQASYSSPGPTRQLEDQYPAAATAAVALAQLHSQRQDSDWGSEAVSDILRTVLKVLPCSNVKRTMHQTMIFHDQVRPMIFRQSITIYSKNILVLSLLPGQESFSRP